MRPGTYKYALVDILIVSAVFVIFLAPRPGPFLLSLERYKYAWLIFVSIWLAVSLIGNKFTTYRYQSLFVVVRVIILNNLFVLGIASSMMYLFRIAYFSRTVVFGTLIVATAIELLLGVLEYYLRTAIIEPPETEIKPGKRTREFLRDTLAPKRRREKRKLSPEREEAILVEVSQQAFDFIFEHASIESPNTLLISTTSHFNIEITVQEEFEAIVNLKRLNDVRYINKFFEKANHKLPIGGLFIDFVETKNLRKQRILGKYPPLLNWVAYSFDFMLKRVFPKFAVLKKIYFFLTRGQNRVFTKAEIFGRLYSCGFEIVEEKLIDNHLFFIARKTGEPIFPEDPTYGPFIKLQRVGYKGKMIKVFKLRTMHPYAEFLQEYIYNTQGLQEGGKFKSDFRVSNLGKFLRIFWLDELPMLFNLLRGDLKLVGVRPLSKHYFSLYSKEHQKRRINYKPGLIPPYYAHMPDTLDKIQASERKYMAAYDKHPFWTDFRYFFMAFWNIVFRRKRSK